MPKINTEQDFWNKVNKSSGPDGCWPWMRSCSPRGYGKTFHFGKDWRAHRLAFFLSYKTKPNMVMHKCDNPPCCNPLHLFPGNHKLNMKDMVVKERAAKPKGILHPMSKLSESDVITIRSEFNGKNRNELANRFGIKPDYIRYIVDFKRWKHL